MLIAHDQFIEADAQPRSLHQVVQPINGFRSLRADSLGRSVPLLTGQILLQPILLEKEIRLQFRSMLTEQSPETLYGSCIIEFA